MRNAPIEKYEPHPRSQGNGAIVRTPKKDIKYKKHPGFFEHHK